MTRKNQKTQFSAVAAAILLLLALPGCFTGIESTAKIKDRTSGKNAVELTAEEKLLQDALPKRPAEWLTGKKFIVSRGRTELAFTPASVATKLQPGDTLYFQSISSATRIAGDTVTDIIFHNNVGESLSHQVDVSTDKILGGNRLHIPFTIEASVIESTRDILVNRELWQLRPDSKGKRYNKVIVADVVAGNSEYPISVILNTGDTIKMLIEGKNSTSRVFHNLFSLSDPRKRYPDITDENWVMICNGRVQAGMLREECRLALGAPASVERVTAYNGLVEHWSYENGVYLNFLDGILTTFRE